MTKSLHMIAVLSVIALISGFALGSLNDLTYEKAVNNILKFKKIPAVAGLYEVVHGELDPMKRTAVEEELLSERKLVEVEGEPVLVFVIKKGGKPYAAAIENFGAGFAGDVGVMVGFEIETGDLVGVGVTTLSETPGLGSRVTEDFFTMQFRGLGRDTVFKVKKDGGEIDAVTGATVSSRAVAQAIEEAAAFYAKHREAIVDAIDAAPGGAQ